MNIFIDVAAVLVIFIFAMIGTAKGFFKGLVGIVGLILSLVLAVIFTVPLEQFLEKTFHLTSLMEGVMVNYFNTVPGMESVIGDMTLAQAVTEKVGIPAFISDVVFNQLIVITYDPTMTIAQILAAAFSVLLLNSICGTVITLFSCLLVTIADKVLTKAVSKISMFNYLNRVSGLILGFAKGLVIVAVVGLVLSMLPFQPVVDAVNLTTFISYLNGYTTQLLKFL